MGLQNPDPQFKSGCRLQKPPVCFCTRGVLFAFCCLLSGQATFLSLRLLPAAKGASLVRGRKRKFKSANLQLAGDFIRTVAGRGNFDKIPLPARRLWHHSFVLHYIQSHAIMPSNKVGKRVIIINSSLWIIWLLIIVFVIIIPTRNRNKLYLNLINRKKKGEPRMLPAGLMKDFIGKVCSITMFNASSGIIARIETTEENWIKVDEKGKSRLLNGDMISNIQILPEKYQK